MLKAIQKQNANPEGLAFCLKLVPARRVELLTFALQVRWSPLYKNRILLISRHFLYLGFLDFTALYRFLCPKFVPRGLCATVRVVNCW